MSVQAYNAVWERSRAKGGPRLVLLALADSCNRDSGLSWLGTPRLAKMTLLTERHLTRILAQLVDLGELVAVQQRPGQSTVFRLTPGGVPVVPVESDRDADTPDKMSGVGAGDTPDKMSGVRAGYTPDKMSPPPLTSAPTTPDIRGTGPLTSAPSHIDEPRLNQVRNQGESPSVVSPVVVTDELIEAVRLWNELAERIGLARVQHFSDARRQKLRRRLAECGALDGWRAALAKVEASAFLTGGGRDGWRADFDFVLQAKSFTKILEGAYDDGPRRGGPRNEVAEAFARMDAAAAKGRTP